MSIFKGNYRLYSVAKSRDNVLLQTRYSAHALRDIQGVLFHTRRLKGARHMHMHTRARTHKHVPSHMHVHACTRTCTRASTCTHKHMNAHTCTRARTPTCTHKHMHAQTFGLWHWPPLLLLPPSPFPHCHFWFLPRQWPSHLQLVQNHRNTSTAASTECYSFVLKPSEMSTIVKSLDLRC